MTSTRPRSAGRPTLDEVAARAGVGRGTVSRVVNGSPQVSPQAREAVRRAIDELGYVPNRAARALVTQRTDSVALVVSESEERLFGEPFFAGIIRGISAELMRTPLQLWLAMAQSPEGRQRVEHHLTTQHVDGVMLLSLHDDDPLPAMLAGRGLPTVLGGRTVNMMRGRPAATPGPVRFVDMDNEGGARAAVEYLLSAGRRRIAHVAGTQDMGVGLARVAGYRAALEAAELPADLVGFGDFREASGAAATRELLARAPDLDAVFAASDAMAIGALRALKEAGRRVPDDVAIVGFENSAASGQTDPPLTTVHQSVDRMGREMARLLIAMIAGEPTDDILLETELVRRATA
ncbi:LacI family transcriptional regulator [Virgisporangium aliadipatigenens]|uniref:LacI family transcriptional regulator n=1 Tax=Virgisporangium aliadipatigenens TaxID=741659 RepID=A0A8J4DS72_9ACTN|nr:LacI family DNA-binding transcriptional regulator [Virgisporangium aliadipatigenens]GIJ46977.1 LacI family transcriptional regulator [Virgisporangium aliadipatigenens]